MASAEVATALDPSDLAEASSTPDGHSPRSTDSLCMIDQNDSVAELLASQAEGVDDQCGPDAVRDHPSLEPG